jgi:hypothetical protein
MAAGGSAQSRANELSARAVEARAQADALDNEARAWALGAEGERRVAAALQGLPAGWHVLHDRLLRPGLSGSNLDHVVVGPCGVFLIDAKNWSGRIGVYRETLWQHAGRHLPKEAELDALSRSAGAMERALAAPVTPVLALAGNQSARFTPQRVRGVQVVPVARLAEWLRAQPLGVLTADTVEIVVRRAATTYPAASGDGPATTSHPSPMAGTAPRARDRRSDQRPALSVTTSDPRPRRRRRRTARKPSRLVGAVLGLGFFYVAALALPGFVQGLVVRHQPQTLPSSESEPWTLLDGSPAPAKTCQGLTTDRVQSILGVTKVYEHDYRNRDYCGWHTRKPANASVPPELLVVTGYTARVLLASQGETSVEVKQRRSSVTVGVPQHMVMDGWSVPPEKVTQPFRVTLVYRYPRSVPSKAEIAKADDAATKKATALAKELAHRLPQGDGAEAITPF